MLISLRSGKTPFWYTCNSYFWVAATPILFGRGLFAQQNFVCLLTCLKLKLADLYTWQQREHLYCQACRRSMGSNVLGDETYSLSVSERASDQTQQAFNCIQYWLELFMLKTFASHTFLITACAIQTKKNLGLETGCHSHRSFKACKSNMYAMNWPHKTLSLTSGRNSWGRNLWNLPSRQLRNISASVWEEPKKHATGNCHWNLWWFWRGKNFELKLVILVPVSFWGWVVSTNPFVDFFV